MPLLVEESAPRRVVVARRGGPHPREEPVHAPRPVALEAEDAARVGDAVLLRGPRRRRRTANLDVAVDGRQVVVAEDARVVPAAAVLQHPRGEAPPVSVGDDDGALEGQGQEVLEQRRDLPRDARVVRLEDKNY